jgi:hypothetical protein
MPKNATNQYMLMQSRTMKTQRPLLCDLELMCNEIPKMKKNKNLKLKPHLV